MEGSMRPEVALLAVLAVVGAETLAVRGVLGAERLPGTPDLSRLPRTLNPQSPDTWEGGGDVLIPSSVAAALGAGQTLERLYSNGRKMVQLDLFVAWFRSQRGGQTQPHSPKVCMPGSGWLPVESREGRIQTGLGTIPAAHMVVTNRGQRAEVLYWYQTRRRVVAGEWAAKFFTIADGLRDRRTDTALVRLFYAVRPDGGETDQAIQFAAGIYPLLRQELPR